jgi:hypothetical protein
MKDFEGLGVFYLGRPYDLATKQGSETPVLYDSKDLVTHAVCVGMTGSGKTGLCLGLLEEAALDGIPAIIIDPKGDLANLLLTFPDLAPEDFAPWINADDAARKGVDTATFSAQQAQLWKDGLARWGQDGARIAKMRDSADFAIYTPGSTAGLPVSVLKSFDPPPQAVLDDREALRELIQTTVTALLSLAGIAADPMQSREHILLSNILDAAWRAGRSLDLAALVQQIPQPPFTKVGVLDLEAFYPAKERFGLAMAINNLIAAPGFDVWMEGEPLDIANILRTPAGKPRIAIFSIAHLSDTERMFFVSLLLNQMLSWMRTQSGTTSLRALLYMDEIFGYFPPVANPPSKAPLLTLLKQARAFGLGVVLATQNPVDLDYKGLSNAGTWFIGRLQTDRDKQRVLDGLEGAAAGAGGKFDRAKMEQTLAALGSRVFLMNNVHEDEPVIFETRWCMSYLRGPLTKNQIKQLMDPIKGSVPALSAPKASPAAAPPAKTAARPVLPPDVPEKFIPVRGVGAVSYQPLLIGAAQVLFQDPKLGVNETREVAFVTPIGGGTVAINWQNAEDCECGLDELEGAPAEGAAFSELPAAASQAKNYKAWNTEFVNWLYGSQEVTLFTSRTVKETSKPGESERDFRLHLQQKSRELRDSQVAALRLKYASKIATLEDRIHRAAQAREREAQQASTQKMQTAISIGTSILGAIFGRKTSAITGIGTGAKAATRSYKEIQDVARAGETVERLQQQLADLQQQVEDEVAQLQAAGDPMTEQLEAASIRPKKSNIAVRMVGLVWRAG